MSQEEFLTKGLKALISPTPSNLLDAGLAALPEGQTAKATRVFHEGLVEDALNTADGVIEANRKLLQLQAMVSALHDKMSEQQPNKQWTLNDVADMLVRLGEEYPRAGHPGKRRMLRRAFFASFDEKYYNTGMFRHFWNIARQIEYPEAQFLARELRKLPSHQLRRFQVAQEHVDTFLANRLVRLELLSGRGPDYYTSALAYQFIEFVWDDNEEVS